MTPTLVAHAVQVNDDPYHYAPYWGLAVQVLSALTDNPALFLALPAGDAAAVPCDPTALDAAGAAGGAGGGSVPLGALPGPPPATCALTGSTAQRGQKPTALRGMSCGAAAFNRVKTFAGVGSRSGASDHPSGNAVDFMIEDYRTPVGRAYGWQVAQWFRTYAPQLGVSNVIFDMQTWSAKSPEWKPYTRYGPNPGDRLGHRNHVHVSFTRKPVHDLPAPAPTPSLQAAIQGSRSRPRQVAGGQTGRSPARGTVPGPVRGPMRGPVRGPVRSDRQAPRPHKPPPLNPGRST